LTYGNTTFLISNSMRLDQDNLKSGLRRNDLNLAFNNLAKNTTFRVLGRRSLVRQRRRLSMWFDYGRVDMITNATCPPEVPDGTLCATCAASFAIESVNEQDSDVQDRVRSIEADINAAIQNGALQQELDAITPDTPLRIEEGKVRTRDTPVGTYSVGGVSYTTIAIIGVCVCVTLLMIVCFWDFFCCITVHSKPGKDKDDVREGPKSSYKNDEKPRGWFG